MNWWDFTPEIVAILVSLLALIISIKRDRESVEVLAYFSTDTKVTIEIINTSPSLTLHIGEVNIVPFDGIYGLSEEKHLLSTKETCTIPPKSSKTIDMEGLFYRRSKNSYYVKAAVYTETGKRFLSNPMERSGEEPPNREALLSHLKDRKKMWGTIALFVCLIIFMIIVEFF